MVSLNVVLGEVWVSTDREDSGWRQDICYVTVVDCGRSKRGCRIPRLPHCVFSSGGRPGRRCFGGEQIAATFVLSTHIVCWVCLVSVVAAGVRATQSTQRSLSAAARRTSYSDKSSSRQTRHFLHRTLHTQLFSSRLEPQTLFL